MGWNFTEGLGSAASWARSNFDAAVDEENLNAGRLHGKLIQLFDIGSDDMAGHVGQGASRANPRIGPKVTLAREIVGHRDAAPAGKRQDVLALKKRSPAAGPSASRWT